MKWIPTVADVGKEILCRCRTSKNWVRGKVQLVAGKVEILVKGILQPLRAYTEFKYAEE